jgi:hypothetical protein
MPCCTVFHDSLHLLVQANTLCTLLDRFKNHLSSSVVHVDNHSIYKQHVVGAV